MEDLAADQIERFAAEGVHVSPVDAIRLDEAARRLRTARDLDGERILPAPRIARAGDVFFREPTVQSELWMEECARAIAGDAETLFWCAAFALAHADESGFFENPDLRSPRGVKRAVRAFQRGLGATKAETVAAVEWCLRGEEAYEYAPPRVPGANPRAVRAVRETVADALRRDLADAIGATGADAANFLAMTPQHMREAVRTALEKHGAEFKNSEAIRLFVEWKTIVEEIANAAKSRSGEGEKKAGDEYEA